MRSIKRVVVFILALSLGLFTNLSNLTNGGVGTVYASPYASYPVTEDSYIQNGTPTTNFGNEVQLLVKNADDSYKVTRKTYMKVNYSGFTGSSTTSALLYIYCNGGGAAIGTVTLSGLTNDSWSESSITWNAPPAEGTVTALGTKTLNVPGWYSFDVTSYINGQMGDKTASFKIENSYLADAISFASSEATTNQPYLKLGTALSATDYTCVKDTFIQGGSSVNTNYGTAASLQAKNYPPDPNFTKISYMMFDYSGFDAYTADSATLSFYTGAVPQTPGLVQIYGLTDTAWSETGVTWNNRPSDDANAVILRAKNVPGSIGWVSVDVTDFINTRMNSGNKTATFRIEADQNIAITNITAREAASNKPKLTLSSNRAGVQAKDARKFIDSIGVNTHLAFDFSIYYQNYALIKNKIDDLGVKHLRDWTMRVGVDPNINTNVWNRMKEIAALNGGTKFTLIGKGDPNNLTQAYTGSNGDTTWDAVTGYNEPDAEIGGTTWASDARTAQQTLWNWAHTNHPSLPVIGTVPANWGNYASIGDLSAYLTHGDIHSYTGGTNPPIYNSTRGAGGYFAQSVEASALVRGTKPYIVTETGWHTATGYVPGSFIPATDPNISAKHLTRSYFYHFNMGAERTFIYELIDEGTSTTDSQQRLGLLDNAGNPKPAYNAMKNMLTVLDDTNTAFTPEKLFFQLDGGTSQYVKYSLLQKRDKTFYLALWLDTPGATTAAGVSKNVNITFNEAVTSLRSCRIKDTTGWTTLARPVPDQSFGVTLYDDVLLLEIKR